MVKEEHKQAYLDIVAKGDGGLVRFSKYHAFLEKTLDRMYRPLVSWRIVLIEIKSKVPPTACALVFQFRNIKSNETVTQRINVMEYWQEWKLENGYYLLAFPEPEKKWEEIEPLTLVVENLRDMDCEVRVCYHVKVTE